MTGPLETAIAAWGEDLPDWVRVLAQACEETSQNRVARRLDRSAALVSNVLRNRYGADTNLVEEIVRGALMSETVPCPAKGALPMDACQAWRRKARQYSPTNHERMLMFRACKRCALNRQGDQA